MRQPAQDEPLLRAYTACIIANVAFLEVGQKRVMEAGGVPLIVRLLRQRDRKVQLHSSAAVQNLTYKNPLCCAAVLEEGGEKWLNKLLRHKSEDIQQFAAGALANLQLYRRSLEQDRAGKGGKGASSKRSSARSTQAATQIQAAVRGHLARVRYEELLRDLHGPNAERSRASGMGNGFGRRQAAGTTDLVGSNRYDVFRVKDVRTQLDILPPSLPPIGGGGAPPAQRSAAIRNVGALQPAVPGASTKGGPRRLEPLSKPPPPRARSAPRGRARASSGGEGRRADPRVCSRPPRAPAPCRPAQ